MQTLVLDVPGMNGEACADNITRALEGIAGVSEARISLANQSATVQFDEHRASAEQLSATLMQAGYEVETTRPAAGKRPGCCGRCAG